MSWIKQALVYCKKQRDCYEVMNRLVRFLVNRGISVQSVSPDEEMNNFSSRTEDTSLLIVLGGDGTFLSAVRWLGDRQIPVVGINLGSLGFLTEISRDKCFEELDKIINGQYTIEERVRFKIKIIQGNSIHFEQTVLNDVVINKGALARIIDLQAYINGSYLTHYRADGLIVATPTGSTAYNISAGGPIVCPTAKVAVITPICSFNLTDRPIVIPTPFEMEIILASHNQEVFLTCDGQTGCSIKPEHVVKVTVAPVPLKFIKPVALDYFQILRTKLKWGQSIQPLKSCS